MTIRRRVVHRPAAVAAAVGIALAAGSGCAPANPPSTLGASFHVRTDEGWTGRRYTDNQYVLAEEYDTNGDGRIDLWRFYSGGHLVAEERDLMGNGRVDYVSAWEGASRRLVSAARDAGGRGVFDLQIEAESAPYPSLGRWRVVEDRDRDGYADSLLVVEGPASLFSDLRLDLATVGDLSTAIPVQHWRERRVANASGRMGAYLRYQNGAPAQRAAVVDARGRPSHWEAIPAGTNPADLAQPISPEEYRAARAVARTSTGAGAGTATRRPAPAAGGIVIQGPGVDSGVGTGAGAGVGTEFDPTFGGDPNVAVPLATTSGGAGAAVDTRQAAMPVPSSAVDRALERRRNAPGGLDRSAALAYPTGMQMPGY